MAAFPLQSFSPPHKQIHRDGTSAKATCHQEGLSTLIHGPDAGKGDEKTHQSLSPPSSGFEIPPILSLEISALKSSTPSEILYKTYPFVQFAAVYSREQRAAIPGFILSLDPTTNLFHEICCLV